jgi:hypothetical protein
MVDIMSTKTPKGVSAAIFMIIEIKMITAGFYQVNFPFILSFSFG